MKSLVEFIAESLYKIDINSKKLSCIKRTL